VDERRPDILTLRVRDLARALAFYQDVLGLPVKVRAGAWAELQLESVALTLLEDPSAPAPAASPSLGWEVEDLGREAERLGPRGVALDPVVDLGPAGLRRAFRDPDGHVLELVEHRIR